MYILHRYVHKSLLLASTVLPEDNNYTQSADKMILQLIFEFLFWKLQSHDGM